MTNLQEAADLNDTVMISARRYEESPFISRQDTSKMVRGVYADRFHAVFCGEDPVQKYWTLRRKALIFDVSEKPLEINGPDAVPFLDKVLSRNVTALHGLKKTPCHGACQLKLGGPRVRDGRS